MPCKTEEKNQCRSRETTDGTELFAFFFNTHWPYDKFNNLLFEFDFSQFDSLESVNCKVNAAALKVRKDVIARREAPHGER